MDTRAQVNYSAVAVVIIQVTRNVIRIYFFRVLCLQLVHKKDMLDAKELHVYSPLQFSVFSTA